MATFVNVYMSSFIRTPSPQKLLQQVFLVSSIIEFFSLTLWWVSLFLGRVWHWNQSSSFNSTMPYGSHSRIVESSKCFVHRVQFPIQLYSLSSSSSFIIPPGGLHGVFPPTISYKLTQTTKYPTLTLSANQTKDTRGKKNNLFKGNPYWTWLALPSFSNSFTVPCPWPTLFIFYPIDLFPSFSSVLWATC